MDDFNESIAYITCQCGERFQVVNEDGTDWDAIATADLYNDHLPACPGPEGDTN